MKPVWIFEPVLNSNQHAVKGLITSGFFLFLKASFTIQDHSHIEHTYTLLPPKHTNTLTYARIHYAHRCARTHSRLSLNIVISLAQIFSHTRTLHTNTLSHTHTRLTPTTVSEILWNGLCCRRGYNSNPNLRLFCMERTHTLLPENAHTHSHTRAYIMHTQVRTYTLRLSFFLSCSDVLTHAHTPYKHTQSLSHTFNTNESIWNYSERFFDPTVVAYFIG